MLPGKVTRACMVRPVNGHDHWDFLLRKFSQLDPNYYRTLLSIAKLRLDFCAGGCPRRQIET